MAGGESHQEARPLEFAWALALRAQCLRQGIPFEFRQWGTPFIKDVREDTLPARELCRQARLAGINTK